MFRLDVLTVALMMRNNPPRVNHYRTQHTMNEPFASIQDALPGDDAHDNELLQTAALQVADILGSVSYLTQSLSGLSGCIAVCHGLAVRSGWWSDLQTGEPKDRNDGELIALMHSELSEALEGIRKNSNDSHLPHRKSVEVELADTLIRIFDYAGARKLDIVGAMIEKLAYNQTRHDHQLSERAKADGKKF